MEESPTKKVESMKKSFLKSLESQALEMFNSKLLKADGVEFILQALDFPKKI